MVQDAACSARDVLVGSWVITRMLFTESGRITKRAVTT